MIVWKVVTKVNGKYRSSNRCLTNDTPTVTYKYKEKSYPIAGLFPLMAFKTLKDARNFKVQMSGHWRKQYELTILKCKGKKSEEQPQFICDILTTEFIKKFTHRYREDIISWGEPLRKGTIFCNEIEVISEKEYV